jgi:ADP-heptose:LPS heptosyltransferase
MLKIGSWDLVEDQRRDQDDEHSFFQVYKKLTGTRHHYTGREPKPRKTCALVRYGAFGDAIQVASTFPGLKRQGFHLTLFCNPGAHQVLKEDPHVDRFIVQGENQVPNVWLGDFWKYMTKKYDRFVNLSESIEGTLLAMPGRINHVWPHDVRHRYMNRNYLEWTHELAQVPYDGKGATFAATDLERAWAKAERSKLGPFVVLWSLAGSSVHKVWPYMDAIIARLMLDTDAHVVLVGGEDGVLLERGWENEPRVLCTSGKWSIRQSMAFCEQADVIIGTETGLMNAAAYLPAPKIITLSHSSVENLTRDWTNTTSLVATHTPCFPCHQMHYGFDYCPRDLDPECSACEAKTCSVHTGTAKCAADIPAADMWEAIQRVLNERERKSA